MYSEIKDNKHLLINRCTSSEKILLEDIVDSIDDATTLSFTKLNGDTGDFEGVMLNIIPEERKSFKLIGELPTYINAFANENAPITFSVEPNDDLEIYTYCPDSSRLTIYQDKEQSNLLYVIPKEQKFDTTLHYEIKKAKYETISGTIYITIGQRLSTDVKFIVLDPDENNYYNFTLWDENNTTYYPYISSREYVNYNLEPKKYTLQVSKGDGSILTTMEYEVTENMLLFPSYIKEIPAS